MTYGDMYPIYQDQGGILKKKVFLEINRAVSKELTKKLLEGKDVTFPYQLGTFQIVGRKMPALQNRKNVNWIETHKLWEKNPELAKKQFVYYTNEHTDGKYYKLKWIKFGTTLYNKNFYRFIPSSILKANITKAIRNGTQFHDDPFQKVQQRGQNQRS